MPVNLQKSGQNKLMFTITANLFMKDIQNSFLYLRFIFMI